MQQIQKGEVAALLKQDGTTLSPNKPHQLLRHHNITRTHKIAKSLGITLTHGEMDACKAGAIAKVTQGRNSHNLSGHGKIPPTMRKYTWISHLYINQLRNAPTNMHGISL